MRNRITDHTALADDNIRTDHNIISDDNIFRHSIFPQMQLWTSVSSVREQKSMVKYIIQ